MAMESLAELNELVVEVANKVVEIACESTSSGNYCVDHADVDDLISYEDYLEYFDLILDEISGREEVLDVLKDSEEFDLNCALAYCPNYEPLPGEEFDYPEDREILPVKVHQSVYEELDEMKEKCENMMAIARTAMEHGGVTEKEYAEVMGTSTEEPTLSRVENYVNTQEYLNSLTDMDEINIQLEDGRYFHMHFSDCNGGYDWTLYDSAKHEIDGGVYDDVDASISEAFLEVGIEFEFADLLFTVLDEEIEENVEQISNTRSLDEQMKSAKEKIKITGERPKHVDNEMSK